MGGIMSAAFAPFVTEEQRELWGIYSRANQGWIEQSAYLKNVHPSHRDALHGTIQDHEHDRRLQEKTISRTIYRWENGVKVPEIKQPGQVYAPLWQVSPADYSAVNVNLLSDPRIASLYEAMVENYDGVLSANFEVEDMFDFLIDDEEKIFKKDPHGFILEPVYDDIVESENQTMVGFVIAITPFGNLLDRLVPDGKDGIIGVLKDDCGHEMTFKLSSTKALFLGSEFRDSFNTARPAIYATLVAASFIIVMLLFMFYDWNITQRQNKTLQTTLKTQAIVQALIPAEFGRQMIHEANEAAAHSGEKQFKVGGNKDAADMNDDDHHRKAAMAQLYPHSTVMFGDLVGFTAWASMRDPHQVFRLLETIYSAFDNIANRRRVFKVETIGDCYVAVCGLPQPRKNHAVVMARFAHDCCQAIGPILAKLETALGPETTDLAIRVGLNSGPITAGVLRADRARFQLFGDTVNTAARMESTGERNRIQISKDTADLLIQAGRSHWVVPRGEKVNAKGKGQMETFWLQVKNETTMSSASGDSRQSGSASSSSPTVLATDHHFLPNVKTNSNTFQNRTLTKDAKTQRLVDWNTEILLKSLREIACFRKAKQTVPDTPEKLQAIEDRITNSNALVFNELGESIQLPHYDSNTSKKDLDCAKEQLDPVVVEQLRKFVGKIASLYRENNFHCFEHASHVTMSVNKLLNRIVTVEHVDEQLADRDLHDNTYGLTSDPLTQFAIVLSALIHDADHYGVTNAQLVKEGADIAKAYEGKSVLEQNSLVLAWAALMKDDYKDLRHAIYCNQEELERFRQILVVTVMATDIADKELKEARNARWEKAFASVSTNDCSDEVKKQDHDRKATIVIEHLIQASDIAHTMQHWHVYRKWNERLFMEMYNAFKSGRMELDPSAFWYKGEIGFFDFYIIPLARKLADCGVFGVSSDEYLNYALKNRDEWVLKGEEVVATYLAKVCRD